MRLNRTAVNLPHFVFSIGISSIGIERSNCNTTPKKTLLLLASILVGLFSGSLYGQALAANWYVRPSGGSGTGTNWTTAWNGFSAISWNSVQPGDTIWVAGGTYTSSLSPRKSGTSSARIYVRRAQSDAPECTGAAGWNASYDSTITQTASSILPGSYSWLTFSGRTTESPPDFGSYGWVIDFNGRPGGTAIYFGNGSSSSNVLFEYMDLRGPTNQVTWSEDASAINDMTWNTNATNHVYSHLKLSGWGTTIFVKGSSNHLSEYLDLQDSYVQGSYHPNIYYVCSSANGTIRYSKIHNNQASGTGIAFSDGDLGCTFDNWKIYGNLFYNNDQADGVAIAIQRANIVGLKIYNNTFYQNGINLRFSSPASCSTGCESKNNLVYGSGGTPTCGTSSNNLVTPSDPFVNLAGKDFHINSTVGANYPRNAGINLSSYFTKDIGGNLFGTDGTWDIGAYEFISSSPTKIPNSPIILQID